jgi:hypothetical protein
MLDRIRNRIQGLFSAGSVEDAADAARQHRHDVVARLQEDIHGLQQEIADLDTAERSGSGRPPTDAESDTMALLHRELAEKQRELARYQARI